MTASHTIDHIRHNEIDKAKWDHCIENAYNGLIYGYSFYLDHMAKNWDALVLNDYEAVMPLTWNQKYGIRYLYQPFLAAQLGVFGTNINWELISSFIEAIPVSFRFAEISLNSKNSPVYPASLATDRVNYTLDLNRPYEKIRSSYHQNIQRNARKASQLNCFPDRGFEVEKVIVLACAQMKQQGQEEKENIDRFRKLYQYLQARKMANTYGIFSEDDQLLASAVFFFSHRRAYYILVGNHPDSKSTGASHALLDAFIKDNAGKNMLLDFEGSDIPNLALFYRGFGASEEKYPAIRINRLPFFLKWLKK